MEKIKLPWHTCSQVVELYGDMAELEVPPFNSLETLRRLNETAKETTSRQRPQSERPGSSEDDEANKPTSNAIPAS